MEDFFNMNSTSMDNMTAVTTEDPFTGSSFTTEEDYDMEIPDLMCNREAVRDFRRHYEPPLFWIIFIVGGAGNLVVVWIYLNFRRRLKTMTDMYLLNLAVADLLFLLSLPLWATEAVNGWTFGANLCKLNSTLYKLNLFSSMLLLTCISLDRYVVIVQTTKAQNSQMERRRLSRIMCMGVWIVALLLAIPDLVFAAPAQVDDKLYCRMVYPSYLGNTTKILVLSLQVSMGFCLPFIIMAFCYSVIIATLLKTRNFQKHKAMRVVLAVVVAFLVSQLPYNGMLVMEATQAANLTLTNCEKLKVLDKVGQVLKSLAYTHACINPFVYVFVGVRFRRDMMQLVRGCLPTATTKIALGKTRSPLSSTRGTVLSDSDNSQALSL